MGKRQHRGEESRLALLEAGIELLQEQDLDTILSARAVAKRAQRSTGSFFHYWETTDDYITDVLDHVLQPGTVSQPEEMGVMLHELAREYANPAALLRVICEQNFLNTIHDPLLRVQLLLWSRHDDPRVKRALGRFYDWTDEIEIRSFELVSETWHRKPRPPLDFETHAVIFTALVEGLAIRHPIQPDRVPLDPLGQVALALIPMISVPKNDSATFDDIVAEIDRYARSGPAPS